MRSAASEPSGVGVLVKDRVKDCWRDTEQCLWFTPAANSLSSPSSPSSSLSAETPPAVGAAYTGSTGGALAAGAAWALASKLPDV